MSTLDDTMGMLYIGLLISCILYGINVLQYYHYFQNYKDRCFLKGTVIAVMLLETGSVLLAGRGIYGYLVTNFGNASALLNLDVGMEVESYFTILITAIVQTFFGHCVLRVCGEHRFVAYTIFVMTFITFALSMTMTSLDFIQGSFKGLNDVTLHIVVGFALGCATVTDIMITLSLCYFFRGNKTGFKATDNILDKLLIFAVNRGVFTFIVQICNTVLFLALSNLIWSPFHLCLSKVYSVSFLATLNRRDSLIRKDTLAYSMGDTTFSTMRVATNPGGHEVDLDLKGTSTGFSSSMSKPTVDDYQC